jgi:uncharacterized membrane protein YcaP (DUF421 family)
LTVFDFILFLIVGGAAQRALMAQDYSLTHAFLVIATLPPRIPRAGRSPSRTASGP